MASIHYLTAVEFEACALQQAARIAQAPGMTRPLVVTAPGLAAQAGAEFTGTQLNPDEQAVDTATRL